MPLRHHGPVPPTQSAAGREQIHARGGPLRRVERVLRRRSLALRAVVIVTVAALLAAAVGATSAAAEGPGPSPAPTGTASATPSAPSRTPGGLPGTLPGAALPSVATPACAAPSPAAASVTASPATPCAVTFSSAAAAAARDIDAFWQATFAGLGKTYTSAGTFDAYTSPVATPCGPTNVMNATYCNINHSIYVDQRLMQQVAETDGEYGVTVIIAHEWGHLVQDELGLIKGVSRFPESVELQADCLAGVYTQDADRRGLISASDLDAATNTLANAGDPKGFTSSSDGAHGTSEQRVNAFNDGYLGGIAGCGIGSDPGGAGQ